MKYKISAFLFFIFFAIDCDSQNLLPFVENYSKYNYQGDNQIWNLVQGKDNAMYFANNHYFLRFDGVKWEKYALPNKTIIRSVFVDGDKIYSGSYKEFGYWFRQKGQMKYVSISKNKNLFSDNGNEEIWKIFKFGSKIYFQSFNELYILNDKKITTVKLPFQISYCFPVRGELLLASVRNGVYKLKGSSFEKIQNCTVLENTIIHAIEANSDATYIFTQKKGVFVANNSELKVWNNPINETLINANINVAKFVNDSTLIIGTGNKGIFIINTKDSSFQNINRENVLMNNSVLSFCFDKENDLWLGLDNGIAHVEINSPVSIFSDNSGALGSVYSVAPTEKGYLMASNHGIFKFENKKLELLPNSQGQAWHISKIKNDYLIGHSEGNFLYQNNILIKTNPINGGWSFTKSNLNNSFLQGTYSGVIIYNNENDISQYAQIKDFYKPIKYIAQNKINEIWAADNYRGLYRVGYSNDFSKIKVNNIAQENNITSDFGVRIFEFRSEILFYINKTWYTYNSMTNLLEKNNLFTANFSGISDIVAIDNDHFLVLKSNQLYQIESIGSQFIWNPIQEKYYRGKLINDNLSIFSQENKYFLNLDDGFIALKLRRLSKAIPTVKVEAYNENKFIGNQSKIKYNTELQLHIISGFFGDGKPNLIYKLDGNKDAVPLNEGNIILNNLSNGSHKVFIYAHNGLKLRTVAVFEFTVAMPWYFSFWMILLYLITIATILYVYYRWNKIRYNQKLALHEEELRHQKKILEVQLKAENELNIQEYEKHILELEVQTKSSEVAGKSLSIAKQSEMIENIHDILDNETDINRLKSEIKKSIKINAVNKHEWETFESNLNQIHSEFIINLHKKYPNLTSKDVKLCVYLKMNLSSKEIAPLMNISFRGVELHRYRLRKKMGLIQDENLYKFMLSI